MLSPLSSIRFGVIGLRRGESFLRACEAVGGATVVALHDLDEGRLHETAGEIGAVPYTDLDVFLAGDFDVVVVASPLPFHAEQAIAALRAGKHVLSEVLPCQTVDEARALVGAVRESGRAYMLAENCVHYDEIEIVRRLVAQGRFGHIYYAEGDYVHDCNGLWFDASGELTWRGRGFLGVYGTHGIGPLLAITGDRVARVRSTVMPPGIVHPGVMAATMSLLEMETVSGAVFRTRVDTHSPRPHVSTTSFVVQGTRGSYESAQSASDEARIWLADTHEPTGIGGTGTWHPLAEFAAETIPDRIAVDAPEVGHGTSEYWLLRDFCAALREGGPVPIDIHAAMDMTLPCILARDSADLDGAWVEVPDSREW